MNHWQKIEQRGRDVLKLTDEHYLYAVDLDAALLGYAEVKFAKKDGERWLSRDNVVGLVEYYDLR
ncbi:hypothetical protein EBB07_28785 [Paenibacillaceae bacterium]|nr:hypothetical protein EBB07_28785 [Paenibacillaceae bacterium]